MPKDKSNSQEISKSKHYLLAFWDRFRSLKNLAIGGMGLLYAKWRLKHYQKEILGLRCKQNRLWEMIPYVKESARGQETNKLRKIERGMTREEQHLLDLEEQLHKFQGQYWQLVREVFSWPKYD
ncbi:MAG TPA: hypothetical protein VJK26_01055 [Patescibacteria group bacterium]|nr:hypothetical protein [Patescibacteria group bacterium]